MISSRENTRSGADASSDRSRNSVGVSCDRRPIDLNAVARQVEDKAADRAHAAVALLLESATAHQRPDPLDKLGVEKGLVT